MKKEIYSRIYYNAFANDLDGVLSDEDIIKAAYAFWFADKESRRALGRCIMREMKKAHNKGCYGLIINMLLDWLAIR